MEKPRIILQRTKCYHRVPDNFLHKDGNTPLYKAFSRFPVRNPHWSYELIEYDGHEYLLDSINEVALDQEGRATHFFNESKDSLEEISMIYIPAADGALVEIAINSNGRVTICTHDFDGEWGEDPYHYWINKGHRDDLETARMTEKQQRCMVLEDRYAWGDGNHHFTEEEEAEAKEIIENKSHTDILSRDEYGNPLVELLWDCDEIVDYYVTEYVYAEE